MSDIRFRGRLKATKNILEIKAIGSKIIGNEKNSELREPAASYGVNFIPKIGYLILKISCFWLDSH